MKVNVLAIIIIALLCGSVLTFTLADAVNAEHPFKNWKALVGAVQDLRIRMTAVEDQIKEIREDIGDNANLANIFVEIGRDDVSQTYDPGDSVAIVGSIDDPVENEDVILKFIDPSGSVKKTQAIEPDDGFFDYVYDIPSTAADGVWEVEAEYASDKMVYLFYSGR